MTRSTHQRVLWPLPVFVQDGWPSHPLDAVFGYSVADPFAVSLSFPAVCPDDELVVWWFARELLAAGLIWPSGDGDVHVAPAGNAVQIVLSSESGRCVLDASREGVGAFLRATYELVDRGAESADGAVEAVLASLFSTPEGEK